LYVLPHTTYHIYTPHTKHKNLFGEYTQNTQRSLKGNEGEKMKRKPLLFSFPLKTLTTFKAKNAEYTQNTRRIHRECLKGGWVFLRIQKMGGRRGA